MYEILHSIDINDLQKQVNQKLLDGYIPLGAISIRNTGKPFKENLGNNTTEIEYYQPILKLNDSSQTVINIFNKSCIFKFN